MAKQNNNFSLLPDDTMIDVVATKGDKVYVQTMTFGQAKAIKKKEGWYYQNFQIGFHNYKTNI